MSNNKPASAAGTPRVSAPKRPAQRPTSGPGTANSSTARPAASSARPTLVKPAPKGKVRRARLQVSKIDPWSVLKMAFLLSVALGIVTVVAAIVLWGVLDLTGVFGKINDLINTTSAPSGGGGTKVDIKDDISLGQVASFATILAVVNVLLLTVLSALATVLYNISSTLVGGIGVTLTDD